MIKEERLEELEYNLSKTKNFEEKGIMFSSFVGKENAQSLRRRYYNIKQRCYNIKSKAYKNYGGRGIKMCEEWLEDKYNFYFWAFNNGFDIKLEIDRIDNNGDYCPENCRWVDRKTQNNNKRNIIKHKCFGEYLTITEASYKYNISFEKLETRMRKHNLTLEDAIKIGNLRKQNSNAKIYCYKNKLYTLKDLSKMFNINSHTLYQKIRKGFDFDKILNSTQIRKRKVLQLNKYKEIICAYNSITEAEERTKIKKNKYFYLLFG